MMPEKSKYSDLKRYCAGDRSELAPFIPESARTVLDIGCATGEFGATLRAKGMIVWGIEPNHEAASIATAKLDNVIAAPFDSRILAQINVKFDCICFNDVLEHLFDPHEALVLCKSIMNQRGCIVCCIPNVIQYGNILQILRTQDWKYTDYGIMDYTHLRFFTKNSILRLFLECGYEVESIVGIHSTHSLKFALINLLLMNKLESMKHVHFVVTATLPAICRTKMPGTEHVSP